jgi:hypothetical protein
LRAALRLTNERFAQLLGTSVRTVANWNAQPDMVPVPELQRALDTVLSRLSRTERQRFSRLLVQSAASESLPDFAPAQVDDIEPWELADALTRASISRVALAEMERAVLGSAARYPSTPPDLLLPTVREQLRRLNQTLALPQPLAVRRQCVTLIGILAGLAGNLALDLGDVEQASGMFRVGRLAGQEADDADLTAWVIATASIGRWFAGQPIEAAQMLAEAAEFAARASGSRRRSWICAMRARALASAGRSSDSRRALDEARTLMATVHDAPQGNDFFDSARLDGMAGCCLLLLGDSGGATELLSLALDRRSPTDAKGRALITLDLAACRVLDGHADEAARLAGDALDLARGAIVRPIVERASGVRASMSRWQGSRAVAELDARLAIAASR